MQGARQYARSAERSLSLRVSDTAIPSGWRGTYLAHIVQHSVMSFMRLLACNVFGTAKSGQVTMVHMVAIDSEVVSNPALKPTRLRRAAYLGR